MLTTREIEGLGAIIAGCPHGGQISLSREVVDGLRLTIQQLQDQVNRHAHERAAAEDELERETGRMKAEFEAACNQSQAYGNRLDEVEALLKAAHRERDAAKERAGVASAELEDMTGQRDRALAISRAAEEKLMTAENERDAAKRHGDECAKALERTHIECRGLRESVAQLVYDRDQLLDAIDKDATGLSEALVGIKKAIDGRAWVTESRGCYEWDDDRYRDETRRAFEAVMKILIPALSKSGDRANQAWRTFERGRIIKLSSELERVRQIALRYGTQKHFGMHGGCDAYAPMFPVEGLDPPGPCNCGADEHNQRLRDDLRSDEVSRPAPTDEARLREMFERAGLELEAKGGTLTYDPGGDVTVDFQFEAGKLVGCRCWVLP